MSKVQIVEATTADIPQILEIVNHNIVHETCIYDIEKRTLEAQLLWFGNQLNQNYPVIVAKDGDKILGYASYAQYRPKVGYQFSMEHSIYIHPEFQKQGIGKLLLTELIDLATKNNVHVLIGGIDANNQNSIEFHQQFGFEIVGRMNEVGYKFDRWLDLVWMQKTI
jgi:phosphinothricin acetyltransferase